MWPRVLLVLLVTALRSTGRWACRIDAELPIRPADKGAGAMNEDKVNLAPCCSCWRWQLSGLVMKRRFIMRHRARKALTLCLEPVRQNPPAVAPYVQGCDGRSASTK